MAEILKGAPVAAALNEKLRRDIARLAEQNIIPMLAIVRIGECPDDVAYERGAVKRCEKLGVGVKPVTLPDGTSQDELMRAIQELNADEAVHGVLLLRPLPKEMDDERVRNSLCPDKDVDGITDASLAGVLSDTEKGYPPCTPQACMEILEHYNIDPKGKKVVVIGRSLVVGKPVAMMLLRRHATVTVCHTKTENMPSVCRDAEILIVAAGRAKIVDQSYLAPGQVVIDVGINMDDDGQICGDVDYHDAQSVVGAITPVPGGVGTVTTSVLVKHVVEAAIKKHLRGR